MVNGLSKVELRRSLLQIRRSLPAPVWQAKSQQICNHLIQSDLVRSSQTILAYFSIHNEPDLSPLFQLPYCWGVPRCVGDSLFWHRWTPGEPLTKGGFGILEPVPEAIAIAPSEVDLMLIPAVACDQQGYRLGYGGGFYDRLLSQPAWATVRTIGIVFEATFLPVLPRDCWDCPLDGVCTEAGLRLIPAAEHQPFSTS